MLFTTIALAFALPASADETPASATSSAENRPGQISKTWDLSYDVAITPYLQDYKRCLNYGNRIARGVPDFEEQYRADIPRCASVYEKAIKESNEALKRRGRDDVFTPADVKRAFDTFAQIHVQRGRFVDDRFQQRQAVLAQYRAAHEQSSAPLDQPTTEPTEEPKTDVANQ